MLVGEVETSEQTVAILPESEAQESRANEVTATLRSSGISCWTAFKGNPKKRGAKARTDGVHSMLYVREVNANGWEFNITTVTDQVIDGSFEKRVMHVLGRDRFPD